MIQCKIFSSIQTSYCSPAEDFNKFIKENNIQQDQIKDIKYIPVVGRNCEPEHNIFLLYDDTPTVMFDENFLGSIQPELYKYINYTGTPN